MNCTDAEKKKVRSIVIVHTRWVEDNRLEKWTCLVINVFIIRQGEKKKRPKKHFLLLSCVYVLFFLHSTRLRVAMIKLHWRCAFFRPNPHTRERESSYSSSSSSPVVGKLDFGWFERRRRRRKKCFEAHCFSGGSLRRCVPGSFHLTFLLGIWNVALLFLFFFLGPLSPDTIRNHFSPSEKIVFCITLVGNK